LDTLAFNSFPSKKTLKKMGFFVDQEGIINRYMREKENWDEHLARTKAFINRFVDRESPDNIAILGSGWLLDVPLDQIHDKCRNIYLVDIRHPRQVIHKYQKLKNVHFIYSDITGGAIEATYNILKGQKYVSERLARLEPPGVDLPFAVDSLVSVNVLCQLDILILEYIRTFKDINQEAVLELRKNIQHSHIVSLQKTKSCLITDYEENIFSRMDDWVGTTPLLYSDLPDSENCEEWVWKFDTQMTYYPNRKTFFKVKALKMDSK
jgi:hypothetical protein